MGKESYLVIGGCGFLGKHIVDMLLARGDLEVAVFDIVQRDMDTRARFFSGDLCDQAVLEDVLRKTNTTCVIHTASPLPGKPAALHWKVNVEGTKSVISACQALHVSKLVYTSSAGVVFDGTDLIDADERMPIPEKPLDVYTETKAKAEELVLAANGTGEKGGLKTVALRPAGIFGPGDLQMITSVAKVLETGRSHFQIGDNKNLFDWTYVANVAHAHLLAADALSSFKPIDPESMKAVALPEITTTVGGRRIPTSLSRPVGHIVSPTPQDVSRETLYRTDSGTNSNPSEDPRPIARSRYDQFSPVALEAELVDVKENPNANPLQVAGQAFFITNGEPLYFWDFMRSIWVRLAPPTEKKTFALPRSIGLALGTIMEWVHWGLMRPGEPEFSRFKVVFTCTTRWYNIEKARRVLGYEPIVGVEEGIERTVKWWQEKGKNISR